MRRLFLRSGVKVCWQTGARDCRPRIETDESGGHQIGSRVLEAAILQRADTFVAIHYH
jgi:hypothetical protein